MWAQTPAPTGEGALHAVARDVASAEDALSGAFASALADWLLNGRPSSSEAWLLTAARRKMIDVARRRRSGEAATGELQILVEEFDAAEAVGEIPDRRLARIRGSPPRLRNRDRYRARPRGPPLLQRRQSALLA